MRDVAELIGIILLMVAGVLGIVLLATTPFALMGWAMTTIVGLFTTVSASYFDCVAVGIGIVIIASIIAKAKL